MSFLSGSGSSNVKQPKLKTVSIPEAQGLVLAQDESQYAISDADWAARFPGLPRGRSAMIGELGHEMGGAIPSAAMGALQTAGLSNEASRIEGSNEFKTARNLGIPILEKEKRDRNYASNLLAMNPERSFGLSGQDILDIVTGNTGNVNAFKQAAFQTRSNAAISSQLQSGQDYAALASLLGSTAKVGANYYNSPYTDPYATVYINPQGQSNYYGPNADTFGFPQG